MSDEKEAAVAAATLLTAEERETCQRIAAQDEDGFLQITDRLSRFSKIGGEMIPHVRVEEALHDLLQATDRCLVVTAVPDERKAFVASRAPRDRHDGRFDLELPVRSRGSRQGRAVDHKAAG